MANPIIEDVRSKIRNGNPVTILILINVAVFLMISLLRIILFITGGFDVFASFVGYLIEHISLRLNFGGLLYRPWTLITHMFTHIDLMHIFWNMITLYWFGTILSEFTSIKKIIPLYLLGGIFGALSAIFLITIIPPFHYMINSTAIGASAGVTAIIVAAATLVPNYKMNLLLIGPVKLVYIAIFAIFIDVLNMASYINVGGNLAHLGGALMGYIFIVQYKKGRDLSSWINQFFDWISGLVKKSSKSKMKVAYRRKISDEEYNYSRKAEQEQIDIILDKISKSGYESLTKTEKEILFKISNKK